MNQPSYSASGRGSQGGNPNVFFVFVGCLLLLAALSAYVWLKDPVGGTLMAQLPPPATNVSAQEETADALPQVKTNPHGEALLEEVLAKPLDVSVQDKAAKDSTQKPADQQLVPADAETDTIAKPAAKADDDGLKLKPQFTGQTDYSYTLKPSETLYGIASRFKTPAATLREANALPDNNLQTGQVLKVRIQGLHKVGPSEGLAAIARTYGVTVADLRKANGLSSDALQLGQELVIPVQ